MDDDRTITVMCVDDNVEVLRAIRLKLRLSGGFRWSGELTSADRLLEETARASPNIVLLDLDVPGCDPFAAMRSLADSVPSTRVVMFTGHVNRDLIDRAIDAGAWGYVSKNDNEDDLVSALRNVMAGEFVLSPDARSCYDRS